MGKRILAFVAVGIGVMTAGLVSGVTPASASSEPTMTPSYGYFSKTTITYHITTTSKAYRSVFKQALKAWSKNGTVKFKAASQKTAMLQLGTSRKISAKKGSSNFSYQSDTLMNTETGETIEKIKKGTGQLGLKYIAKHKASRAKKVAYAVRLLGFAVGLENTNDKKSVMGGYHTSLAYADRLGVAYAYRLIKTPLVLN